MEHIHTPLSEIRGIPPRFVPKLKKLGIITVRDLLFYIPTRYIDFSRIVPVSNLEEKQEATIHGTVIKINSRRTWHRKMHLVEAYIQDDSGTIRATWFNQSYIQNVLPSGQEANFSGKPIVSKTGELYLSNPTYEIVYEEKETKHTGRIVPIYPETKGLTSKGIRYLISLLLKKSFSLEETIPESILKNHRLPRVQEAIRNVHFPEILEEAERAKRRFIFEDLFLLQLNYIQEKENLKKKTAFSIPFNPDLIKKTLTDLPFELTLSQKKALFEILKDMERAYPMNRLLQGDVGSGKTVVVALAALPVSNYNLQTAFMAPTEILAKQHYMTLQKLFPSFENGMALLTSSECALSYGKHLETGIKKSALLREIEQGKVSMVIGTHTLIQQSVSFKNLGLVIIDEQHRFGVKQRAELLKKTHENRASHLLSMSATPIPRTLSLAFFGDLDISIIDELPKNRKTVITKIIPPDKRKDAYQFIRKHIREGRQAFVVCPRIEPRIEDQGYSDTLKLEIRSVKEEYEKLSKIIFPDLEISMLHGKIPTKGENSKTHIMKRFADGDIDILVSTSVIEVGVDVPNASIMMIEGSERFGLAQLYQFRGRVGRGEHQSYCFLFTDSSSLETKKRLNAIAQAKNGLELAEQDLHLRGPGEFLGDVQTGTPDYAMQALKNPNLLLEARKSARDLFNRDPDLTNHIHLKKELNLFEKRIHLE